MLSKFSAQLSIVFLSTLWLVASILSFVPRDSGDYIGYIDFFSSIESRGFPRDLEVLVNASRYLGVVRPEMGLIFLYLIATLATYIVAKKHTDNCFQMSVFILSLSIAYLGLGYFWYLRQFIGMLISFIFWNSIFKLFFVVGSFHINSALVIACLKLLSQYFSKLIIGFGIVAPFCFLLERAGFIQSPLSLSQFSYGWYTAKFESDPINRISYEYFIFIFILIAQKFRMDGPITILGLILFLEFLIADFAEALNRITFFYNGLAIFCFLDLLKKLCISRLTFVIMCSLVAAHGTFRSFISWGIL